jgi:hypothetical protein
MVGSINVSSKSNCITMQVLPLLSLADTVIDLRKLDYVTTHTTTLDRI